MEKEESKFRKSIGTEAKLCGPSSVLAALVPPIGRL